MNRPRGVFCHRNDPCGYEAEGENYFDMKRRRRHLVAYGDGDAVTALTCPYCGEPADLEVEDKGPSSEEYVEDCPVCCRPWTVRVSRSDEGASVTLDRGDS